MGYVVAVATVVRQTLRELPADKRQEATASLRSELTGKEGDTTAQVRAWQLQDSAVWWTTALSCGYWAVYRALDGKELQSYRDEYGKDAASGYYVGDLRISTRLRRNRGPSRVPEYDLDGPGGFGRGISSVGKYTDADRYGGTANKQFADKSLETSLCLKIVGTVRCSPGTFLCYLAAQESAGELVPISCWIGEQGSRSAICLTQRALEAAEVLGDMAEELRGGLVDLHLD
jgi:hypothetical protein